MRERIVHALLTLVAVTFAGLTPIVGAPPALAVAPDLQPGVSVRLNDFDAVTPSAPEHTAHPDLKLISVMAPWRVLEPTRQVLDPTSMATLNASIQDARTGGYKIILRIMAGRLEPQWLVDAGATVELLGTDVNASDYCNQHKVVVPWDDTLKAEYTWLMDQLGQWLQQSDGAGGTKGDHVFAVPVSMPSFQGTEMNWGYGPTNATCPPGTGGAGQDLAVYNRAKWDALPQPVNTQAERQVETTQAWKDAIEIHMAELPSGVHSSIAYGALFGDQQASALEIAQFEVPLHPDRLWSLYTNLQPAVLPDGTLGSYRQWSPKSHEVMMAVTGAHGLLGFQTASVNINDTSAKFHAALEDGLKTYGVRFLETQPDNVTDYYPYLLTESDNVQARIRAVNHQRATMTAVSCNAVTIGQSTTCTATVTDEGTGAKIVPSGALTVSWPAGGSFTPQRCTPDGTGLTTSCSVTYAPAAAGTQPVTASYLGDSNHAVSAGTLQLNVARRTTQADVDCGDASVAIGVATTCTATVTDTSPAPGGGAPTGSVSWTSDAGGSFAPASCALVAGAGNTATCHVSYTGATNGNAVVTGTYGGGVRHDGSADGATVRIVKRTTTTAVSCNSPVLAGSAATCTATVTDTDGGTATLPQGTVAWSGGSGFSSTSCTVAGSGAQASCSVTFTPATAGTSTLSADYGGDQTHLPGGGSAQVTATLRQTSTSVQCQTPVVVGSASTCTGTVTDTGAGAAITPGGTVNWSATGQGNFSATSCTPMGSGAQASCSVAFTPTAAGAPTVTAAYGGDQRHASSAGSTQLTGNARQSSTSVDCQTPVLVGSAATCTVTVTDTQGGTVITPTGQVGWSTGQSGTFAPTSCTLSGSGGVSTCSVGYTPSAAGAHTVTAQYAGSVAHGASSGSTQVTASARQTSTSVACESPVPVGAAATCTATVTDIDAGVGTTPGSTVSWTHSDTGTLSTNSCMLAGTGSVATCSVTLTRNTGGTETVTATYGGDNRHTGSGGEATVQATKRLTTTSVDCGAPALVGAGSTCTVTVTDSDAGPGSTPTNAVAWTTDGAGDFNAPTCMLGGSGSVATCSVTYTRSSEGTDTVTATYGGDGRHFGSNGAALARTIRRTTTTSVACGPPILMGSASTCTVTVTDTAAGSPNTPGGSVNWSSDGSGTFSSGTCGPAGSGATAACSVTYAPAAAGTHTVTAGYAGDQDHGSSTGSAQISVSQRQTTTSVHCDTPVLLGSASTCTATVTDTAAGAPITPDGAVSWFSGGEVEEDVFSDDACTLAGSGATATCSVTYTPSTAGAHTIGATYGGLSIHATSSGGAQVTVTSPQLNIALRSSAFAANSAGNTLVLSKPAGASAGDVMVAVVGVRSAPTVTPPSGWTLRLTTPNGSNLRQLTYTKVATASEPATFQWTFNQKRAASGGILAYSGVSQTSPIDVVSGGIGSSSSIVAPSATTTSSKAMVVGAFSIANGAAITPPAGMTERGEVASSTKIKTEVADVVQATAGPTGSKTAVASSGAANVGQLIVLRPGSGTPPPNQDPTFDQDLQNRTNAQGAVISLSAHATDPELDTLTYAATGLPTGLSINTSTGLISGTISSTAAAGSPYATRITVSDDGFATVGATDTFTWTVTAGGGGGSITFRSASTGANNVGSSVAIATPAGVQSGDVMVAVIDAKAAPTVATPAGWTLHSTTPNGSNFKQVVYSRVATGSEPASTTWTINESRAISGAIVAYAGVSTSSPVEAFTAGTGTTASITAPSATSAFNGAMVIGAFGINADATIAPPAGMTERGEIVSATRIRTEVCDFVLSAAGATGAKTATASAAAANIGQLIVLRPA